MTAPWPILALLVPLLGCGPEAERRSGSGASPAGEPAEATNDAASTVSQVPRDAAHPAPDLSQPLLTPEAERSVKGARNVLLSFARAIELGEYDQAWALLGPGDRQKWSREAFTAIFAGLDRPTVAVPDGTMGEAAGSSFYAAPITITGNDADGRPVRIEGKAVLRRANDIEGANAQQRRWHFDSLTLDWVH